MTTWRLLKREGDDEGESVPGDVWHEVGTYESEHAWTLGFKAAETIGAYHGPGEFLLLGDDERYKTIEIGARREFYEIVAEEPEELEPVSLKAAPSAADVMAREG